MRVYILDKSGIGLEKMLIWLTEKTTIQEVSVLKNPEFFMELIEREQPDMVFIRLGDVNIPGLKIGEMVNAMDKKIKIVFVADERDYAIDAYEIGAYGYLLCPMDKQKFEKCLNGLERSN